MHSFLSEGILKIVQILPSHGHHSYEMGSALLLTLGDNFSSGRKPAGEGASLLDSPPWRALDWMSLASPSDPPEKRKNNSLSRAWHLWALLYCQRLEAAQKQELVQAFPLSYPWARGGLFHLPLLPVPRGWRTWTTLSPVMLLPLHESRCKTSLWACSNRTPNPALPAESQATPPRCNPQHFLF